MGYDTSYSLEIYFGVGAAIREVPADMKSTLLDELFKECSEADYALDILGNTGNSDARWYECANDMKHFSARHPDFVFILSGEGSESGDIWKIYAKAGKTHKEKAVLTIAPYDPNKLT